MDIVLVNMEQTTVLRVKILQQVRFMNLFHSQLANEKNVTETPN